jgi:hypothetical protein
MWIPTGLQMLNRRYLGKADTLQSGVCEFYDFDDDDCIQSFVHFAFAVDPLA